MKEHMNLARWVMRWAEAARLTVEAMEGIEGVGDPIGAIGAKDALTLVLVDAIHNVRRGSVAVLGSTSAEVRHFDVRVPGLGSLRDTLEHFDEYLQWAGRRQGVPLNGPGFELSMSYSVGHGHVVEITVYEKSGPCRYLMKTREAASAAKELAMTVRDASTGPTHPLP